MGNVRSRDVTAIVFDVDRTLIVSQSGFNKSLGVATDCLVRHLRRRGIPVSRNSVLKKLGPIASYFEKRGSYARDEWWRQLLRDLGLSRYQGKWIHRVTLLYWRTYIAMSPPYHDAEKTVRALHARGYRLALVSDTDGTPGMKRRRIRALPFYQFFETAVVAGEDTPHVKPDKASFVLVAKKLRLRPVTCVYVGDNPRVDVEGARNAGMQTIIVRRRSKLRGARPDLTVDRLSRLLAIFKGRLTGAP